MSPDRFKTWIAMWIVMVIASGLLVLKFIGWGAAMGLVVSCLCYLILALAIVRRA